MPEKKKTSTSPKPGSGATSRPKEAPEGGSAVILPPSDVDATVPVPFAQRVSQRRSLARAEARLDLVLERLAAAKESSDRQNPIDTAHAEALFDLVWDAQEDIAAVLRPGR